MGGKGGCRPSAVSLVTELYRAVEGSEEKDSMNGRRSRSDVFYKKVFLKISQYTKKNICAGVSFK